jgi:sulfur relay protein TusB/DsrH
MLHIINNFPLSPSLIDSANSGDTVIFTDNAVLAVKQENIEKESLVLRSLSHINLYVRKADLILRNISNNELLRGVVIIDDMQFKNAISQDFAIKSCN